MMRVRERVPASHGPTLGRLGGLWCCLAIGLSTAGCGGVEYHDVIGRVTLDGKPLEGAAVSFMPESEEGLFLYGRTGPDGRFTLRETQAVEGAPVGRYQVRISTYRETNTDGDEVVPGTPERIPSRYNSNTELTAEVGEGENDFPFELSSDGEIDTPDPEDADF